MARSASGVVPGVTRKIADSDDLAASAAAGCGRSRTPSRPPGRSTTSPPGVSERHRRRRSSPIAGRRKCALPSIAPPTVPGVPAHASRPASAAATIVQRTRPLMVTPASARIARRAPASMRDVRAARRAPRTPASPTSTFEPPPRGTSGRPSSAAARAAAVTSSVVSASRNQSAGPPIRKVVYGASAGVRRAGRRRTSSASERGMGRTNTSPVSLTGLVIRLRLDSERQASSTLVRSASPGNTGTTAAVASGSRFFSRSRPEQVARPPSSRRSSKYE